LSTPENDVSRAQVSATGEWCAYNEITIAIAVHIACVSHAKTELISRVAADNCPTHVWHD
jgi:hypothetical protein